MERVPGEAGPSLGSWAAPLAWVTLGVAVLVLALDRAAPFPSADVSRGSDAAFVQGLEPREVEGGIVRRRWAGATLAARFVHLPLGPLKVSVAIRGHRDPVTVMAEGAILGVIPKERSRGTYDVPEARGGRLTVTLHGDPFLAGDGRRLAFMLERITVDYPPPRGLARLSLFLVFLAPAWVTFLAARLASLSRLAGLLLALGGALAQAVALWPQGILRSDYSVQLAFLSVGGVMAAAGWVRLASRGVPSEGGSATGRAFAALVLVLWVQGVAATHPCLVTSDGVFHAHKVEQASAGEYFPVSLTPHEPPYRFPYGVTFHLLVAMLLRAGIDAELGVRVVAAAASVLASAVLLRTLLPWGAARAALCVGLLQLLPTTFGPFSAGNFSNIFAQAVTVLFLCWAIGPRRGGWPLGAALLALAATTHFGALLVLLVLGPALVLASRRTRDAQLLGALAAGLGLAGLYYLHFLRLMTSQLARVLEGGRGGGGPGLLATAGGQLLLLLHEWGEPAVIAVLLGAATMRLRRGSLPRPFFALWASGGVLALVAILSPLEVRYLYALAPAVALLAADGLLWLRGQRMGKLLAFVLLLIQAGLAARGLVQAVVFAYRAPP